MRETAEGAEKAFFPLRPRCGTRIVREPTAPMVSEVRLSRPPSPFYGLVLRSSAAKPRERRVVDLSRQAPRADDGDPFGGGEVVRLAVGGDGEPRPRAGHHPPAHPLGPSVAGKEFHAPRLARLRIRAVDDRTGRNRQHAEAVTRERLRAVGEIRFAGMPDEEDLA